MCRDEPAYFTKNGTKLPARLVDVLLNIVILRRTGLAVMSLWIHTRDPNNGFCPRKFVERLDAGELQPALSENKGMGEYFNLRASCPSTPELFPEVVYSNRSPTWRLAQPWLCESRMGRWDDKRLR